MVISSVMRRHCDYTPQVSGNIAMPL